MMLLPPRSSYSRSCTSREFNSNEHDLIRMTDDETEKYLRKAMRKVPLEQFIGLSENYGNQRVKEEQTHYDLFDEDTESVVKLDT